MAEIDDRKRGVTKELRTERQMPDLGPGNGRIPGIDRTVRRYQGAGMPHLSKPLLPHGAQTPCKPPSPPHSPASPPKSSQPLSEPDVWSGGSMADTDKG